MTTMDDEGASTDGSPTPPVDAGTREGDAEAPTADTSTGRLETRRIAVFLAVAFGLSWATGLAVFLTGGLAAGPTLLPGVPFALVLVAGPYMFAPSIAHVATRAVTGEGWRGTLLRPHLRRRWREWLVAYLGPVGLVLAGVGCYFAVFPGQFGGLDAVADLLAAQEAATGLDLPFTPAQFVGLQVLQALVLAPVLNGLFTFGEEFGWRAYLLPKLAPLGWRRALLASGVVWGVWHWPIVAMGHNYGLAYPGAPWLGLVVMVAFTVVAGVFLGWVTLRGGSVWPAVLGHATINGIAGLGLLFLAGPPHLLLGPTMAGLLGMAPTAALAAWLLRSPARLAPVEEFEAAV